MLLILVRVEPAAVQHDEERVPGARRRLAITRLPLVLALQVALLVNLDRRARDRRWCLRCGRLLRRLLRFRRWRCNAFALRYIYIIHYTC